MEASRYVKWNLGHVLECVHRHVWNGSLEECSMEFGSGVICSLKLVVRQGNSAQDRETLTLSWLLCYVMKDTFSFLELVQAICHRQTGNTSVVLSCRFRSLADHSVVPGIVHFCWL